MPCMHLNSRYVPNDLENSGNFTREPLKVTSRNENILTCLDLNVKKVKTEDFRSKWAEEGSKWKQSAGNSRGKNALKVGGKLQRSEKELAIVCFPKRRAVTKRIDINSLPRVSHERILSYLSLKERFQSFSLVCRNWYKLSKMLPLEYLVDLEEFECFPFENANLCYEVCSLVERLIIHDGSLAVSKDDQVSLLPYFQNLRVLTAWLSDAFGDNTQRCLFPSNLFPSLFDFADELDDQLFPDEEYSSSLHFGAFSSVVEASKHALGKLCVPFLGMDRASFDMESFFVPQAFPDLKHLEFLMQNVRTEDEQTEFLHLVEKIPKACPELRTFSLCFIGDDFDHEYDISELVFTIQNKFTMALQNFHRVEWDMGYFRTNLTAVNV